MSNAEIQEIEKYCHPNSLLVITETGELKRLECPFRVLILIEIGELRKGQTVAVNAVKIDLELILVYVIRNKGYHYFNFSIL